MRLVEARSHGLETTSALPAEKRPARAHAWDALTRQGARSTRSSDVMRRQAIDAGMPGLLAAVDPARRGHPAPMTKRTRIFIGILVAYALGVAFLMYRQLGDIDPRYRESAEDSLVDTAQLMAALVESASRGGALRVDGARAGVPLALRAPLQAPTSTASRRRASSCA